MVVGVWYIVYWGNIGANTCESNENMNTGIADIGYISHCAIRFIWINNVTTTRPLHPSPAYIIEAEQTSEIAHMMYCRAGKSVRRTYAWARASKIKTIDTAAPVYISRNFRNSRYISQVCVTWYAHVSRGIYIQDGRRWHVVSLDLDCR